MDDLTSIDGRTAARIIMLVIVAGIVSDTVLHECGHALASIICGLPVVDISWFPPITYVDLSTATDVQTIFVAFAGVGFPCMIGWIWHPKNLYLGVVAETIRLESIFALIQSVIGVAQYSSIGTTDITDMEIAMQTSVANVAFFVVGLIIAILISTALFLLWKPLWKLLVPRRTFYVL